jgi:hypothetical protein
VQEQQGHRRGPSRGLKLIQLAIRPQVEASEAIAEGILGSPAYVPAHHWYARGRAPSQPHAAPTKPKA